MNTIRVALAASVALGVSTPVFAQSAGCSTINGFRSSLVQVRVFEELVDGRFRAGEEITLTARSVVSSEPVGTPVWAFADLALAFDFGDGAFSPTYSSSNTPIRETIIVPTGGISGLALTEFGPWFTDLNGVVISCGIPILPIGAVVSSLAGIGVIHQNQSLRVALDHNLLGRLQGGERPEAAVTRSSAFVSTQGMSDQPMDGNAWLSLNSRAYFDGYEGHATDFSAGMDWLLSESSIVGVVIGAGLTDLEDATVSEAKSSSLLIGAYGAYGLASGVLVDGYLAYSVVDYDVGDADFDTNRTLAGLSVNGNVSVSSGVLQPRVRLSGSWEDFPTDVVGLTGGASQQYRASIGARHDWNSTLAGTGLKPWASLDFEYGYQEDTDGLTDDFFAPRLGIGLNGTVGLGVLTASIDVGRTTSDVYDAGLALSYEFKL